MSNLQTAAQHAKNKLTWQHVSWHMYDIDRAFWLFLCFLDRKYPPGVMLHVEQLHRTSESPCKHMETERCVCTLLSSGCDSIILIRQIDLDRREEGIMSFSLFFLGILLLSSCCGWNDRCRWQLPVEMAVRQTVSSSSIYHRTWSWSQPWLCGSWWIIISFSGN